MYTMYTHTVGVVGQVYPQRIHTYIHTYIGTFLLGLQKWLLLLDKQTQRDDVLVLVRKACQPYHDK